MIYTVTLNPAVDYVVHVPVLTQGQILRSTREQVFFGGKGVNVSSVLHTLGVASVATGFLAGFTGQAIETELARQGIGTDFVFLPDGFTRINLKLRTGVETDINGGGPVIGPADLAALEEKLTRLRAGDIAVLAGSVPLSLAGNPYADLMAHLAGRGLRFVVDTTGAQLRSVLPLQPFLVKPNGQELGELFGVRIASAAEAAKDATRLQELGARNVLVSLGAQGAVLADETGCIWQQPACRGETVNTVGAGDSMVAGFLAGFAQAGSYQEALRLGTACGSATAFCEGLAAAAQIHALQKALAPTQKLEKPEGSAVK